MSEPTSALETQPGDDLLADLADDFLRRHRGGDAAHQHPDEAVDDDRHDGQGDDELDDRTDVDVIRLDVPRPG